MTVFLRPCRCDGRRGGSDAAAEGILGRSKTNSRMKDPLATAN